MALRAQLRAGRFGALLPAALGAATAGLVGAAGGGYFETSWGWSALFLLWGAALALVLGRPLDWTASARTARGSGCGRASPSWYKVLYDASFTALSLPRIVRRAVCVSDSARTAATRLAVRLGLALEREEAGPEHQMKTEERGYHPLSVYWSGTGAVRRAFQE